MWPSDPPIQDKRQKIKLLSYNEKEKLKKMVVINKYNTAQQIFAKENKTMGERLIVPCIRGPNSQTNCTLGPFGGRLCSQLQLSRFSRVRILNC